MPRLRNSLTGVTVDVDDATAAKLGREYHPVEDEPKPEPKKAAPKRSK